MNLKSKLDLDWAQSDPRLSSILGSALKNRSNAPVVLEMPKDIAPWNEKFFGLEQVTFFKNLNEEQRLQVLMSASKSILEEAYFIEKSGLFFSAKMNLMAENTQERLLYSFFSADEAAHFSWISSALAGQDVSDFQSNPFLRMIDDLLSAQGKTVLTYLIQVILEGWGLTHYRSLAEHCQIKPLSEVFRNILKDESRHHGSGLILMNEQKISDSDEKIILGVLEELMTMIRVGPQSLVSSLEKVRGGFSTTERIRCFEELKTEETSSAKLQTLQTLIRSSQNAEKFVRYLDDRGLFKPMNPTQCAGG